MLQIFLGCYISEPSKKMMLPLFLCCFLSDTFHTYINDYIHETLEELEIRPDPTIDCRVNCPEASEKIPIDLYRKNGVATFFQLFLIRFFSYLQVMMTYMRAWIGLKFGQIRSQTKELAAFERLKIDVANFSRLLYI